MPQYISKIILNGVTQMDVTPTTATADKILQGFGAYGSDGSWMDGTATGGSEDIFIVTLSWDDTDELWIPDKTITELQDAYSDDEEIIFICDDGNPATWFCDDDYVFIFSVLLSGNNKIIIKNYLFNTQGVEYLEDVEAIFPNFDSPSVTYTPTESRQIDTITYDPNDGYNGLQQVNVTVNAVPAAELTGAPERVFVTPTINLDTSTGEISIQDTAVDTIQPIATAGWVATSQSIPVQVETASTLQLSTQAAATITPTTSSQTAVAAGKYTTGAVTVAAMPSGSATPAASISGTSATVSTGTNTLTLSKTVSNTPQVSAGYISAGTAGNSSVSLTANVTTKAAATITPTTSNQTIASGTYLTGTQTISGDANLVAGNIKSGTTIFGVTGTYEGGGGMQVATKTTTLDSASASISFSGLSGEPTSFAITTAADLATGASPWKTAAVTYDGTNLNGQIVTNTSNAQASHSTSFTKSYSNGTLTVTGTGTNFQANQYKLVYTYGGTSANLGTDDVQVGSGATSISFTGLSAEPDYFSLVFTSDFSTSSGYQRVMAVVYDGNSTYGVAMDSGAKALSSWSYTYNNGTLTVSSTGTNNGGYFHQPGDYHLIYGIGGTVEPVEIEVEPLSVTQNGTYTAPDGKAYSPVTVNVSGGGSVNVATTTWTNSSTSTTSHQFTGLLGTPKMAVLRCTATLSRSSNQTYYYIADIVWNGTNAYGNYHLRSNGSLTNVASNANPGYSVTVGTNSITFSSGASSRSNAPGTFYNGTYELTYVYS